jgi:hypothetical protein
LARGHSGIERPDQAWLFDEDAQALFAPETHPFAVLSRRVGHDQASVRRVLNTFLKVTMADFVALERSAAIGNWPGVKRLATRIHEGCQVIEDAKAATLFAPLLVAASDFDTRAAYSAFPARRASELLDLLGRVSDFLANRRAIRFGERAWPEFFAGSVMSARVGASPRA